MRAGNVIAFGVDGYKGKETVIVVAEVKAEDLTAVRRAIHHSALEVSGLPPRDIMLVRPGTLPKTSSGKLQRAKCRESYLLGNLNYSASNSSVNYADCRSAITLLQRSGSDLYGA